MPQKVGRVSDDINPFDLEPEERDNPDLLTLEEQLNLGELPDGTQGKGQSDSSADSQKL